MKSLSLSKMILLSISYSLITSSPLYSATKEDQLTKLNTDILNEKAYVELLEQTKAKRIAYAESQLKEAKSDVEKQKWERDLEQARTSDLSKNARNKVASLIVQRLKLMEEVSKEKKNVESQKSIVDAVAVTPSIKAADQKNEVIKKYDRGAILLAPPKNASDVEMMEYLDEKVSYLERKAKVKWIGATNNAVKLLEDARKEREIFSKKMSSIPLNSNDLAFEAKQINKDIENEKAYTQLLDQTKQKRIETIQTNLVNASSNADKEQLESELTKVKAADLSESSRNKVNSLESEKSKLVVDANNPEVAPIIEVSSEKELSIMEQARIAEDVLKKEQNAKEVKKRDSQIVNSNEKTQLPDEIKSTKLASLQPEIVDTNLAKQKVGESKKDEDNLIEKKLSNQESEAADKKIHSDFAHAESFMEVSDDLTKVDKSTLLKQDRPLTKMRVFQILNSLESIDKEESIKRITYLGGRKVLPDEHFYMRKSDGTESFMFNPSEYRSSAEQPAFIHSYEVEPHGKFSVLQAGKTIFTAQAFIIHSDEEAKEMCFYVFEGTSKKCKQMLKAYRVSAYNKSIKNTDKTKFTRVAVNEIARSSSMLPDGTGFFRSLNLVKEEKGKEESDTSKIFAFEFSLCVNKLKILAPKKIHNFNNADYYQKLGGKYADAPLDNCKRYSVDDLKNLDFKSIYSKDNSKFDKLMATILKEQ